MARSVLRRTLFPKTAKEGRERNGKEFRDFIGKEEDFYREEKREGEENELYGWKVSGNEFF